MALFHKDMFKEFFKRMMFYITVPKCIFCGEILDYTDKCFCPECKAKYDEWKNSRNCSRCAKVYFNCKCTNSLLEKNNIHTVYKLYRYRPQDELTPSKRIIFALKEDHRRDVIEFLADELSAAIVSSGLKIDKDAIFITNVPRRRKAIIKFGYDHAAELAKAVAKHLDLEYVSLLVSQSKRAQKKLSTAERRKNAKIKQKHGDFSRLKGKCAIIVDDIITTGASISAVSDKLKELGIRKRVAACVAIAYKDMDEKRKFSSLL